MRGRIRGSKYWDRDGDGVRDGDRDGEDISSSFTSTIRKYSKSIRCNKKRAFREC